MKKAILESLFTTLLAYFLSFIVSIPSLESGNIRIGDIYKTDENLLFRNIEITNYTDSYINDLLLKIPRLCKIENEEFISSLLISKKQSPSLEYSFYSIDMIEPKSSSLVTISVQKNDKILFPNYRNKKLTLTSKTQLESPYIKLLKQLAMTIAVYFIFLFIFQIITDKKTNELLKQIEDVKKEKEELKEEANSIKNRICSFQKEYTLRNLFLKKQIRDYEKELSFWRNVVSQVLYTGDKKHTQAEILFDSVTKQLESYTVKSKQNLDLDEILFVAKEINNDEKK